MIEDRLRELLLEGTPIGDGLLHAVSLGCPQIVQTICDFLATKVKLFMAPVN